MPTDPSPEDEPKWRRRLGSGANNRGWELSEKHARTREEDDEMLNAAHASAYLWSTIGTVHNAALAQLLLGQVHALLGLAATASRYAAAALEYFAHRDSAAWELAIAHAVAANAAHCAGSADAHRAHYAAAEQALQSITAGEERQIVLATLRIVPRPAAGAG
jgi:hypothetical protein